VPGLTEQNEEEFVLEALKKIRAAYPVFKPVSSPDFQINAANQGHDSSKRVQLVR
jgi:hypothetical protein